MRDILGNQAATFSGLLHTHSQSMRIVKCFLAYILTVLHIYELLCTLSDVMDVGFLIV